MKTQGGTEPMKKRILKEHVDKALAGGQYQGDEAQAVFGKGTWTWHF